MLLNINFLKCTLLRPGWHKSAATAPEQWKVSTLTPASGTFEEEVLGKPGRVKGRSFRWYQKRNPKKNLVANVSFRQQQLQLVHVWSSWLAPCLQLGYAKGHRTTLQGYCWGLTTHEPLLTSGRLRALSRQYWWSLPVVSSLRRQGGGRLYSIAGAWF